MAQLALNRRQLSQLYLLAPGAQTAGGGSFDNIRFSGRANQENAVRFDGVEASSIIDASSGNLNGEISTGLRLQNSLETVSEFRVDSSNYPAEFGTGTAGQISVISKSGGNDFHGGLFECFRNSSLDARKFFDGTTKTPLRLNQFGGSVGGPIKKDKLFFLSGAGVAGAARLREPDCHVPSASVRTGAVPSIQPLLAGYPTGTPDQQPRSGPRAPLRLFLHRRILRSFRIDHQISSKFSRYLRYNRDQGYITQRLVLWSRSGSGVLRLTNTGQRKTEDSGCRMSSVQCTQLEGSDGNVVEEGSDDWAWSRNG